MTEPRPVNILAPLAERIEAAAVSQDTPFETALAALLEVGLRIHRATAAGARVLIRTRDGRTHELDELGSSYEP